MTSQQATLTIYQYKGSSINQKRKKKKKNPRARKIQKNHVKIRIIREKEKRRKRTHKIHKLVLAKGSSRDDKNPRKYHREIRRSRHIHKTTSKYKGQSSKGFENRTFMAI